VKDFAPVALVAGVPFGLIVNPSIPATTLSEFKVEAGTGLRIGRHRQSAASRRRDAQIRGRDRYPSRAVSRRGPALLDLIAGHIAFMVVDRQPALRRIREGKVRVLGVTTPQRVTAAPDIPTLAESGLPSFELVAWQGVVAPAGTPRPITDELVGQIGKLVADPAMRERFAAVALEPIAGSTPENFAGHIKTEADRWATIVRSAGVELE
jgi:tripartite-type tricarboxylate transporter receptor subunit TctC